MQTSEIDIYYPLKHWFFTNIISSLCLFAFDLISQHNSLNDATGVGMLFFIFGSVFSIPTFIVYLLTYKLLIKTAKSIFNIKLTLNIIGVLGIFLTMNLIGGTSMTFGYGVIYSVILIIFSLVLKIKNTNSEEIQIIENNNQT